jgi:hypothetical protein
MRLLDLGKEPVVIWRLSKNRNKKLRTLTTDQNPQKPTGHDKKDPRRWMIIHSHWS